MSDYSVGEGDGFVRVCASLEGELERSVTAALLFEDETTQC